MPIDSEFSKRYVDSALTFVKYVLQNVIYLTWITVNNAHKHDMLVLRSVAKWQYKEDILLLYL